MGKPTVTKKNTQKCTQDIRSIPPARYALPNDGRKVASLCKDRKALLILISSWANGDGTSIKVSVPELAKAQGCSTRTIKYRLKELKILGFLKDGEIDGFFHTRVRAIDIQQVTDSQELAERRVQDSSEKGAGFTEKGAGLHGKGAGLTDLSTVTVNIPSPQPSLLTEGTPEISGVCLEPVETVEKSGLTDQALSNGNRNPVSSHVSKTSIVIEAPALLEDPFGGGPLSPEAKAKKAAREAAEEEAKWKLFQSKKDCLAYVESVAALMDESIEIITEVLPDGFRVRVYDTIRAYRGTKLVGYIPRSQKHKKTAIGDGLYICHYGECENLSGDLSLYCEAHKYGYPMERGTV